MSFSKTPSPHAPMGRHGRTSACWTPNCVRFRADHPRCAALHERARGSLFGGVPMPWMMLWAGGYPVAVDDGAGRACAASTGSSSSTCASATRARWPATRRRRCSRRCARRAGSRRCCRPRTRPGWGRSSRAASALPRWLFTLTATDANRTALRIARMLTGRPRVLVYSYCYHGSVDEAFAVARRAARPSRGRATSARRWTSRTTTTAIEFNDLDALEAALRDGEIACVLAEPAMTNMGIVLPDDGYHEALRALCRARHAADHRRDAHVLRRAGRLHRGVGPGAGPADDRQGDRRRRARAARSGCPRTSRSGCSPPSRPTTRTPAASAARWPATRCRSRRCARRWARC